jgi:dienelactone hydrolase
LGAVAAAVAVALAAVPSSVANGSSPPAASPRFVIAERVFTFVDHTRVIRLPGRRPVPRPVVTVVRYPVHARGPFGLIVFAHGFDVTPAYYFRLLTTWAQAGYVVAAPVFPLSNKNAPGGPHEADIVNQPGDVSFVITRLLAASAQPQGPIAGLINPHEIAVAGQSDGAETALAVADNSIYRDPRVDAAIVLSGAELSIGKYFTEASPPLLAAQGTADIRNEPRYTYAFFKVAPQPKYLLKLIGAGHLPPYTYKQPQLSIVERVTLAFLKRYLDGQAGALSTLIADGNVPGFASLVARG